MEKKIAFILTLIIIVLLLSYVQDYLINYYIIMGLLIFNTFMAFFYPKYFLVTYLLFLCFVLLWRETKVQEGTSTYFLNWLRIVFKNKTVFINVFGNVVLFIPLGFALKYNAYYGIIFSVVVELLQNIWHKGVLDYYDIILNSLGIIIGLTFWELYIWIKKRRKRKKLMNSLNS